MKNCIFYARDKRKGREFTFTLDDLYGYEGEESGIFIKDIGTAFSYNSGYSYDGMNPDLEIYDIKVIDRED